MTLDFALAAQAAVAAAVVGLLGVLGVLLLARRSPRWAAVLTPVIVVLAVAAGVLAGARAMVLEGTDLAVVLTILVAVVPVALVVGVVLVVALAGQRVIARLGWAADPHGRFRRGLGLVFILVGVAVALGWDRDLQAWILEHSPIQPWNLDSGFLPEGSA